MNLEVVRNVGTLFAPCWLPRIVEEDQYKNFCCSCLLVYQSEMEDIKIVMQLLIGSRKLV